MRSLKYAHIYLPVFAFLWPGLFLDSAVVAKVFSYNQWFTNLLALVVFFWIYQNVSKQVKQLMLFGLVIATGGEVVFSLILEMYTYRLGNVPLYVPLGHTVVYASVYYLAKEPLVKHNQKAIINSLYILMIVYSLSWLVLANDLFGFICMLVILWIFKRRPTTKLFFLLMFFMVAYLELVGTYYQCWHWPVVWFDKLTWVPSANPPSGISVFYFGFDAGCLWLYKKVNPHKWQRFIAIRRMRREACAK